ncbi:hypothetical protein VTL71DRAFT_13524 [Oculimacula yallundae]|uniref:Cytochrome P450 n=1 Tax=Oculimacula yallundae TaxID=86028 RepID=A0ABR4CKQ7_9HELO
MHNADFSKCGGEDPACGRCTNSGRVCPGYQQKLEFVYFEVDPKTKSGCEEDKKQALVRVSAKSQHPEEDQDSLASAKDQTAYIEDSRTHRELNHILGHSLTASQHKMAFTTLLNDRYIPNLCSPQLYMGRKYAVTFNWMDTARDLASISECSEMLGDSLLAMALSLAAAEGEPAHMFTTGIKHYSQSLSRLRRSLVRGPLALDDHQADVGLVTCLTCAMYEMMANKSFVSFMQHLGGVGAILKARGVEKVQTPMSRRSFYEYRAIKLPIDLASQQASFLSDPDWINPPWKETEPQSATHFHTVIDISYSIPVLMQKFTRIRQSAQYFDDESFTEDLYELLLLILGVQQAFDNWDVLYRGGDETSGLYFPRIASTLNTPEIDNLGSVFPISYEFPNWNIASALMYYEMSRIYLNGLQIQVETCIRQRSLTTEDDPVDTKHLTKNSIGCADRICQSVEWFFEDNKKMIGKMVVMAPFEAAKGFFVHLCEVNGGDLDFDASLEQKARFCDIVMQRLKEGGMSIWNKGQNHKGLKTHKTNEGASEQFDSVVTKVLLYAYSHRMPQGGVWFPLFCSVGKEVGITSGGVTSASASLNALDVLFGKPPTGSLDDITIKLSPRPPTTVASWTKLWRLRNVSKGKAHLTIIELHKKYGKLVRTSPNVVDVSDPAMIPVIYNVKGNYKKTAFYTMAVFYWNKTPQMNSFSMTDETAHKEENKKIASAFSMTNLLEVESGIDSCSKFFMKRLHEVSSGGRPVDLSIWLQYYTFDAMGEITFGEKFGFLEQGKDVDQTMQAIDITLTYNAIIGQIPLAHKFLLGIPGLAYILPQVETMNTILNFTLKAIKSRSSSPTNVDIKANTSKMGKDMLSRWTSVPTNDPLKMSKRDLIAHLSSNVFAGSDTTATTLRAAVYYLCKNPMHMTKLVSEIDEAASQGLLSDPPSYREASQLPYLNAVIKESLRISPSIGLLLERHVPTGGAIISGQFIPANTIVGINAWALHYDEVVFPNPETFIPERWIENSESKLREMERSFFAFGAGSRTCTGKNLSLMEIVKIVPCLLREFSVELVDAEREWQTRNMWFVQQWGLECVLTPRKV